MNDYRSELETPGETKKRTSNGTKIPKWLVIILLLVVCGETGFLGTLAARKWTGQKEEQKPPTDAMSSVTNLLVVTLAKKAREDSFQIIDDVMNGKDVSDERFAQVQKELATAQDSTAKTRPGNEGKYASIFDAAQQLLDRQGKLADGLCEEEIDAWQNSSSGRAQEAIDRVLERHADAVKIIKSNRIAVQLIMTVASNDVPAKYVAAHDRLVHVYGTYSLLYMMGTEPSGSLANYIQNVNAAYIAFSQGLSELAVSKP